MRSRLSRPILAATFAGTLLFVPLGCAQSPSCAPQATSSVEAVETLVDAAIADDSDLACTVLPADSSADSISGELAYVRSVLPPSTTEDTPATFEQVDQMGSGYTVDATFDGQTVTFEVSSTIQGRFFWKKDVYTVSPSSYVISHLAPTPSTTAD